METEWHEIADAFPLMQGEEFNELCADVARNGLIHPIITLDGKILDGRNRYRACIETKVKPRYVLYEAKLDPIDFVIGTNLVRRMLTTSQKAAAAAEIANMRQGGDGSNQYANSSKEPFAKSITQTQAAEKLGVSKAQVKRATAIKKADKGLFDQVKKGAITVGKAEAQVKQRRTRKPPEDLEDLIPGQVFQKQRTKATPGVGERIAAAVNSGKGLVAASKEAEESEDLGLTSEHLRSLIDLLDTEIRNRSRMKRVLKTHHERINDV